MLCTRSKQKCVPTHLTCVYSTNWKLVNSPYLCLSSAPLPLELPLHDTDSTANYLLSPRILHEPQEWFLHQFCPFSFGKEWHFPCFTTEAKNSLFHFITSSETCFMQQHKHWEQTGVMNSCEEPTEDQSKLGIRRTISPSSGGDHALKRLQNTPNWKPTHPP